MVSKNFSSLVLFVLFLLIPALFAQGNKGANVKGFVYDESNGEALIGANIYLKDVQLGGSTNDIGYFVISGVSNGKHILIISYIGYKTEIKEIEVNSKKDYSLKIYLMNFL